MHLSSIADPRLRAELLAMADDDQRVRAELAADGSLYDGYHPRMEMVHRHHALRLAGILDQHGWPGRTLVGADGAHAAWLVAQHAIGDPTLQRRVLELIRTAAAHGEAALLEVAMLEDRIRVSEGRSQRYGTQYDWDENGEMSPLPLDDPDHVNERRRAVGLGPLDDDVRARRERVAEAGQQPPANWARRERDKEDWYRGRGWR